MARTYKRDARGRFAGGGGSSKKPAKKTQQRGTNRIRRDNAGKIQGIGGTGATGRGGRLRTAKGNERATVTMQAKGVTPRGAIKGKVRRDPGAMAKARQTQAPKTIKVATKNKNATVAKLRKQSDVAKQKANEISMRTLNRAQGVAMRDYKQSQQLRTKSANLRERAAMQTISAREGVMMGRVKRDPNALRKIKRRPGASSAAIEQRRNRVSRDGMFLKRSKGTKKQKAQTLITRQNAARVYDVQKSLKNTGQFSRNILKRGTPRMAKNANVQRRPRSIWAKVR